MRRYKINITIGKRIQRIRRKSGYSQEDLAEIVGVHRNHIGRIERGEINTPMQTINKICKALKVKITEIIS